VKMTKNRKKPGSSPARFAAVQILDAFHQKMIPLKLILNDFDSAHLSSRDWQLTRELVFGTVRWEIQIDWYLRQFIHGSLEDYPLTLKNILRTALYQLRFLEKIPDFAAVNEAVNLAHSMGLLKYARLVNGVLRNFIRRRDQIRWPKKDEDPVRHFSLVFSFPEWMVRLFLDNYGEERTSRMLESLNQKPGLTLRVSPAKIPVEEFLRHLRERNIEATVAGHLPEYVRIHTEAVDVRELPGYREGWFVVQDEAAGYAVYLAAPGNGHTVFLDACVAPGGKFSHWLERYGGRKHVAAGLDLHRKRLELVCQNMERLQLHSAKLVQGDARKLPFKRADIILLDVPCSGFGVIRKNPDIKLRRTPEDVVQLVELQNRMLEAAAEILEPKGSIIYSTCTVHPAENEKMVRGFLKRHPEFEIEPADQWVRCPWITREGWIEIIPGEADMDGAFCVRLTKRGE